VAASEAQKQKPYQGELIGQGNTSFESFSVASKIGQK
jgi:hypothetical protein